MTQVIVTETLRTMLQDFSKSLELCDESGRVLARVIPVLDPSRYERVEPELSREESERRRQEPDYSTAEVLAHLEKL
jgi:hypothetical protein